MQILESSNKAGASIFINVDPHFVALMNDVPEQLRAIDGITNLDPFEFRRKFLQSMSNVADNSIDPNANMDDKSPVSLTAEMFKPLQRMDSIYVIWKHLNKKYGREIADRATTRMVDGTLYFHDSTKTHIPYCIAASSYPILSTGLPFGANPKPPKRSDSYTNQTIEFIMQLAQEVAGAVAIPDYFVNYAWYSKRENKSEYLIKQDQERLVFTVNNNFRVGGDSPFTNLPILDKTTFMKLFEELYFPDGSKATDYWDEVERVQDIFCKWFSEGNNGIPFKFPVVTVNAAIDDSGQIIHEDFFHKMMVYNKKLCCFNFYGGEKLAMCCRFTNDLGEMRKNVRFNSGFGNGGINIGSHRVVAVNLHRIALETKYLNGRSFFDRLEDAMVLSAQTLDIHRNSILKKRIEQRFLKFFNLGWLHLNMFFSTIGMIGFADAVEVMTGVNTTDPVGLKFGEEIQAFMEKKASEFTKQYDAVFNIEECPAEGAAGKLAKKDAFLFGEKVKDYNMPYLLSNQSVPLEDNVTIIDRAKTMGRLMQMSGGSIAHINIVDEDPNPDSLFLFGKRLLECKIPHFAFNKGMSVCAEDSDHVTYAMVDKCKHCGGDIAEQYTRVIGYFVPVTKWGKPRRKGLSERKFYHLNGADKDAAPMPISVCKSAQA